ncbi:MAG TPA: hypothetical protein VLE73_06365 [Candidatus Saccharimonadales bacterium]|nr:hypothetical protein [Candidatus Saccharimonadales bacterium]
MNEFHTQEAAQNPFGLGVQTPDFNAVNEAAFGVQAPEVVVPAVDASDFHVAAPTIAEIRAEEDARFLAASRVAVASAMMPYHVQAIYQQMEREFADQVESYVKEQAEEDETVDA